MRELPNHKSGNLCTDVPVRCSYDTADHGIGKLAEVVGPNGYRQVCSYDALGRAVAVSTTIDGQTDTFATEYDTYGRAETSIYPTGFAVRSVYNGLGYLAEIRDDAEDTLYWQAGEMNAQGQLTMDSYGNGLTTSRWYDQVTGRLMGITTGLGSSTAVQYLSYGYDTIGNVTERTDHNQTDLTETFTYDRLNRLRTVRQNEVQTKAYDYDAIGNITYKSDIGYYTYGSSRPHAVTSTSGLVNNTYTYDADGNMISGAGRVITYTSFNKPSLVTRDGNSSTFVYGPDREQIKQVAVDGGVTATTVYVGGLYERVIKGEITEYKHYIIGGNGVVAIYAERSDGTSDTRYLHKDHLGSTDVITDENGDVVERLSFDPFGKRRFPTWEDDAANTLRSLTDQGFTGHKELDGVGLVHMGGRVYDPDLGRFLSPDPFVQSMDGQALNRYTYCFNNPLSGIDPTGYNFFGDLWEGGGDVCEHVVAQVGRSSGDFFDDWLGIEQINVGVFCGIGGEVGFDFTGSRPQMSLGLGIGAGVRFGLSGPTLNTGMTVGAAATVGYHTGYGEYYSAWAGCMVAGFGVGASAQLWVDSGVHTAGIGAGVGVAGVSAWNSNAGGSGWGASAGFGVVAAYNSQTDKIDFSIDAIQCYMALEYIASSVRSEKSTQYAASTSASSQYQSPLEWWNSVTAESIQTSDEYYSDIRGAKGPPKLLRGKETDPISKLLPSNYKTKGINNLPGQRMPVSPRTNGGLLYHLFAWIANLFPGNRVGAAFVVVPPEILTNPLRIDSKGVPMDVI